MTNTRSEQNSLNNNNDADVSPPPSVIDLSFPKINWLRQYAEAA